MSKADRIRRLWPLYLVLRLAGVLGGLLPARWPRRAKPPWKPGVSVLIPESGTPDLLADTIADAKRALARVDEPTQLVVVVNGASREQYTALLEVHPDVDWQFHRDPLGYNGAIVAGLAKVRHDGVYLLNSDMRLEADAIAALLPYRRPEIFSLTSQIFFTDPSARREETGWSDFRLEGDRVVMFEREIEDSPLARGNLYPGGGSSLCRTDVLRRYARGSACYSPFYWEDADWGARAWSDGYECVFVPASRAHHIHRGTVKRYYGPSVIQRIIDRNQVLFELRHHWTQLTSRSSLGEVERLPEESRRELMAWPNLWSILWRRTQARVARRLGLDFGAVTQKFYPLVAERKPRVLLVTPFALFPPAHGGARRVAELVDALSDRVEFVLLTDERSAHGEASHPGFAKFRAVHLVEGRGDQPGDAPQPLDVRVRRHAHPKLRAELRRLLAVYQPDIVQVEFMELATLADERTHGDAKWTLSLHDVYLSTAGSGGEHDALQREWIGAFDAVTVCSTEDAALLGMPSARLVPNGAISRLDRYRPSTGSNILFMGPFRYAPNREAIEAFLRDVFPAVRAAVPDASVTILGGVESAAMRGVAPFDQPGVTLVSNFVDPAPYLDAAALTINPQVGIRGSALKLVESLLAGRICVTTVEGARGFRGVALPGLVACETVAAMATPVIDLLRDASKRHAIERADDAAVEPLTWRGSAAAQFDLYRELLR